MDKKLIEFGRYSQILKNKDVTMIEKARRKR